MRTGQTRVVPDALAVLARADRTWFVAAYSCVAAQRASAHLDGPAKHRCPSWAASMNAAESSTAYPKAYAAAARMTAMQTLDSAAAVQSCSRCRLVADVAGLVDRHRHPACWADRLVAAFPLAAVTNALRPACCRPAEQDACARQCVSVDRRLASLVAFGRPLLAATAAELGDAAERHASRQDALPVPVLALALALPLPRRQASEVRRPLLGQFALALQVRRPQPEPWLQLEPAAGQRVSPLALPVVQRRP